MEISPWENRNPGANTGSVQSENRNPGDQHRSSPIDNFSRENRNPGNQHRFSPIRNFPGGKQESMRPIQVQSNRKISPWENRNPIFLPLPVTVETSTPPCLPQAMAKLTGKQITQAGSCAVQQKHHILFSTLHSSRVASLRGDVEGSLLFPVTGSGVCGVFCITPSFHISLLASDGHTFSVCAQQSRWISLHVRSNRSVEGA